MQYRPLIALLGLATVSCGVNRAPPAPALPVPPVLAEEAPEATHSCLDGIALLPDGLFSSVLRSNGDLKTALLTCEARRRAAVEAYDANRGRIIEFNRENGE